MKLFKKIILVLLLSLVMFSSFACAESNGEYTITWVVNGETVKTTTVKKGETPSFDGETPTKASANGTTYTFSKWTPDLAPASGDATYTAEFTSTTKRLPATVGFETQKFVYDGTEHTIEVTNLPTDATVTYENNGRTEPGNQKVTAKIDYYGMIYEYSANIIIEKQQSVLTISDNQTINSAEYVSYTLNNEEQTLSYVPIYQPGKYLVEVYAEASEHYNESAHYEVNVIIEEHNPFDIIFPSTCTSYLEGESVTLVAQNLPEGYTATYENNTATTTGKKHVVCHVFDSTNAEAATLKCVWTVDYHKNEAFNAFLDQLLIDYLADDFTAWNAFVRHPELLGYDRSEYGDAEWYIYEPLTEENRTEAKAELAEIRANFNAFDRSTLSLAQQVGYDFAKELLDELDLDWEGDLNGGLENITYLDSYGGYVGNLNSSVENYILYSEQEVKDIINYIKSASVCFPSYVVWAQAKIDAGFPLSDYTLTEMIKFLDEITKAHEQPGKGETDYFLVELLTNHINAVEFLSDEQKANYVSQLQDAFTNDYFPAIKALSEALVPLKGHITEEDDEGYWAKYDDGAERYLNKLRSNIGNPDLTIEEYLFYVDKYLKSNSDRINEIIAEYRKMNSKNQSKWISFIEGTTPFVNVTDPDDMVAYLKHFAKYIVPQFENDINVSVKYMDTIQGKQTTTQAYYYNSPVDEFTDEHITLNPVLLGSDYNETLSTMAHEGYPGHLYAHVLIKDTDYHYINMIFDSTGFGEGWAKYVELVLKQYILEHSDVPQSDKRLMELAIEYLICNSFAGYLIYCKVDEMAHYEHKSIAEISKYVEDMGYSASAGLSIYRTVIENPVVYNSYGFGQIYMYDTHIECEQKLGALYNEVDFNRVLLEDGQFDLWTIKDIMNEYVADQLFLYGSAE
ncbi:MAG: DUF885 family protein [Bacilli bacterium]|nr:DUF885 family protein [Bacilli bacterium]